MSTYLWGVAEAISQLFNALLGGNPNMTLSARAYVNRERPRWRTAYKTLNRVFFWQEDHCRASWTKDIMFARHALFELGAPKSEPTVNPMLQITQTGKLTVTQ